MVLRVMPGPSVACVLSHSPRAHTLTRVMSIGPSDVHRSKFADRYMGGPGKRTASSRPGDTV